jgi:hypothetical protein
VVSYYTVWVQFLDDLMADVIRTAEAAVEHAQLYSVSETHTDSTAVL